MDKFITAGTQFVMQVCVIMSFSICHASVCNYGKMPLLHDKLINGLILFLLYNGFHGMHVWSSAS